MNDKLKALGGALLCTWTGLLLEIFCNQIYLL